MEQVTPLFESWKEAGQRPELDLESVENLLYGRTGQELVEMVQPCLGTVSQDLADVFAYMLDNELLDAEVLEYVSVDTLKNLDSAVSELGGNFTRCGRISPALCPTRWIPWRH